MSQESSHSNIDKFDFKPIDFNLFSLHQVFTNVMLQKFRLVLTMSEDSDNNTIMIRLGKKIKSTGKYHYIEKYIPVYYFSEIKTMIRLINIMGATLVDKYSKI